jgi:hypothetical protein
VRRIGEEQGGEDYAGAELSTDGGATQPRLRLVAHGQRCRPRLCGEESPLLTTASERVKEFPFLFGRVIIGSSVDPSAAFCGSFRSAPARRLARRGKGLLEREVATN